MNRSHKNSLFIYRLLNATGRESDNQSPNLQWADAPVCGSPNAENVHAYGRLYAYDKMGNIQSMVQSGSNGFTRAFTYNTGKNTLQKVENATPSIIEDFTYDACGNQTLAGTNRHYVWDHANRLLSYYNQAGGGDPSVFTQYDYSGHDRISKLVRTGTAGSPIYERTIYIDGIFEYHILENGTTYEKNYVHIMDNRSRIAEIRVGDQFPGDIADAVTYNLEDQIGSSAVRLNTSGGVIDKEEYYPFGDSSLRTFSKKRYRYVGKEKDLESGLYYYGARYYAAWTCRFISVDPLAADYNQLTPYQNAGNNPINDWDIDGQQGVNTETAGDGGAGKSGAIDSEKTGTPITATDGQTSYVLPEAIVFGTGLPIVDGKIGPWSHEYAELNNDNEKSEIIPQLGITNKQAQTLFTQMQNDITSLLSTELGRQLADEGSTFTIGFKLASPTTNSNLNGFYRSDGVMGIELATGIEINSHGQNGIEIFGIENQTGIMLQDGNLKTYSQQEYDLMGFRVTNTNTWKDGKISNSMTLSIALSYTMGNGNITITYNLDLTKVVPPELQKVEGMGLGMSKKTIQNQVGKIYKHNINRSTTIMK